MANTDAARGIRLTKALRRVAVSTQRRRWSRAAAGWDHHGVTGLSNIIAAVLDEAHPAPGMVAVDIGAGTGALTLPLAGRVESVIAVDISPEMLAELTANAGRHGVTNIETRAGAIEELDLAPASVDLVVSNYALHHLLDRDKDAAIGRIATWLRPGASVVIGDMMMGRGADPADRAVIAAKARVMLGRGPGGWWRLAKNAWRYLARTTERPISMEAWSALLVKHGMVDVRAHRVVAEGSVVRGTRPPAGPAQA